MALSFSPVPLAAEMPGELRGAVVAIGNFDGVHRGHQAVLEQAMAVAARIAAPTVALSFEPHPRTFFKPQSAVFRLTPLAVKEKVLRAFGLDGLVVAGFDREFAATTAEEFVATVLCRRLGIRHAVTGFNFHFGKDRRGTPDFLQAAGRDNGFGVTIVEPFFGDGSDAISSSGIRRLLGDGRVHDAAQRLGYRWLVSGEVREGRRLGRTLGFPTANMMLPPECHLAHGIYVARLRRADGRLYNGVASYGRRPTFDDGAALLETFVFDFDGDLYGETVDVSLFAHLRAEEKLASADLLVEQMKRDEANARAEHSKASPLSALDRALSFDDGEG